VVSVDPSLLGRISAPPRVFLEQVLADKKPVGPSVGEWVTGTLMPTHPESAPLVLPPGRGELEFHYTALHFQAPEELRFKYQLEGADNEWVDAGTRRTAHYNNLYPGSYRFQVIACNKEGLWNEEGSSVALVLRPHVWQTWWFQGSAVLLVIGAASGSALFFTRRRMQRKLERLEQRHAIEKERGRIAKDIHDDLGSSLTRIMMLGERAEDGLGKREDVGLHVGKIVATARGSVQALDEIVWAVNPENDTLEGLVEYISHYADEFFENTPVGCRLEIPVQLPRFTLSAEIRHDLFLVVKEAFNNLAKHAQASEVHVEVSVAGSALEILIEDNGCGFEPGQPSPARKGNGLGNMRKRIEALGGSLWLQSAPGQGTHFKITVPLTPQPNA
jgi:signal transduction histidine kinase